MLCILYSEYSLGFITCFFPSFPSLFLYFSFLFFSLKAVQSSKFCASNLNALLTSSPSYSKHYSVDKAFRNAHFAWSSGYFDAKNPGQIWIQATLPRPQKMVRLAFQGSAEHPYDTPTAYELWASEDVDSSGDFKTGNWDRLGSYFYPDAGWREHAIESKPYRKFRLVIAQTGI